MKENCIHVAVGVLLNEREEVLIALRPEDSHQGGLWEFPGGKLEQGESVEQALAREFEEELGIQIRDCVPLRQVQHDYGDKSVLLDIWFIGGHTGTPTGREGQEVSWRHISALKAVDFPEANAGIIRVLDLPRSIAITPAAKDRDEMEAALEQILERGAKLVYFRQKALGAASYDDWFSLADRACRARGARLIYRYSGASTRSDVKALHVDSQQLLELRARPANPDQLFSASCHTLDELRRAESLGADFAFLSPVCPTEKYPASQLLGWKRFGSLVAQVGLPVFALGGMGLDDLATSRVHRGYGIAGISLFQPKQSSSSSSSPS